MTEENTTTEAVTQVSDPSPSPETTTKVEETNSVTPAENTTTEVENNQPSEQTSEELYELPDGRKVDAKTLEREFKEKFMPDYTKKSQTLAEIQRAGGFVQPQATNDTSQDLPKWAKPDWTPNSYQEILEAATEKIQWEQAQQIRQQEAVKQEVSKMVEDQLTEIRKVDPNVSEELLYQHANKYGFGDLISAHKNMTDFKIATKRTEQRVEQNIRGREADPIAVQTQQATSSDALDYRSLQNDNRSPLDVLRGLKGK